MVCNTYEIYIKQLLLASKNCTTIILFQLKSQYYFDFIIVIQLEIISVWSLKDAFKVV